MPRKLPPVHAGDSPVLRRLALAPAPKGNELRQWLPVLYLEQVVGSYMRSRDKRAMTRASETHVRTFLLLVAEDITRKT